MFNLFKKPSSSALPLTIFITSYGRTASHWIAAILDDHPDINCSHGSSVVPVSQLAAKEEEILLDAWSGRSTFYEIPLGEFASQMQRYSPASICANVHGYTASNLAIKIKKERMKHSVVTANIVRHPFPRINSFVSRCQKYRQNSELKADFETMMLEGMEHNPTYKRWMADAVEQFDIDSGDWENRLFVWAVLLQCSDVNDIECGRQFKFENLTSDPDYLRDFLNYVTQNRVAFDDDAITRAFQMGKQDSTSAAMQNISKAVASWKPWQLDLIAKWSADKQIQATYNLLNYDLDLSAAGSASLK